MSLVKQIENRESVSEGEIDSRIKWLHTSISLTQEALEDDSGMGRLSAEERRDIELADMTSRIHIKELEQEIDYLEKFREKQKRLNLFNKQQREEEEREAFLSEVTESSSELKGVKKITEDIVVYYTPHFSWYRDNMLLTHHVSIWHRQTRNKLNTLTTARKHATKVLLVKVAEALSKTSPQESLRGAQDWIMDRRTQPWEREKYRMDKAGKGEFTNLDAYHFQKDIPNPDIDILQAKKVSFLLDPASPVYYDTLAYATLWWLSQVFTSLDIDTSFLYWDLEYEYYSLRRPRLGSPVISRSGNTWLIFKGGRWEDDQGEWLRCTWCGPDILDCLVEYIRLIKDDQWMITDRRGTGTQCDLVDTELYLLAQKFNFAEFDV